MKPIAIAGVAVALTMVPAMAAQNSAKKYAPGQRQQEPGQAKKFAPGQRQKQPGQAKKFAPGQQKNDGTTIGRGGTPR